MTIAFFFIFVTLIVVVYYFLNENYFLPKKIEKINQLFKEEDYENALKFINSLPFNRRMNPEIQYKIYSLYVKQSQFFMALFHLNEMIKRKLFTEEYNELFIRMKVAELFEKLDKNKKALEEYQNILKVAPDYYDANYRMGEKLYLMKNFDAAFPFLEKAYKSEKQNTKLNFYLAEIYFSRLDFDQALDLINFNINNGDAGKQSFLLRALIYLALNKYNQSLEDALLIQEDSVVGNRAKIVIAICYRYLERVEEALDIFDNNLHHFHNDYSHLILEARYILSDLLKEKGELKNAIRHLQLIQNSGKDFKDVKERLSIYTQAVNNELFSQFYGKSIDIFIKDVLAQKLTAGGQQIKNTEIINSQCAFFTTRRNISTGQGYRVVVGIDMAEKKTPEQIAREFIKYIKKEQLSSGVFYSCFGIDKKSKTVFNQTAFEITLADFNEINKMLLGEILLGSQLFKTPKK